MSLDDFARYPLLFGPSPVHRLDRLTAHLGGAAVWAKREDCNSGIAFGGNKTRKLEYLVADALAQGCDTLVSIGGVQSNHTRQVAAVAARAGLQVRAGAGELGRLAGRRLRQGRQHPDQPARRRRRAAGARPGFGIGFKESWEQALARGRGARRQAVRDPGRRLRPPARRARLRRLGVRGRRAGARAGRLLRHRRRLLGDRLHPGRHGRRVRRAGGAGGRPRRVLGVDASAKPAETRDQVARIAQRTAAAIGARARADATTTSSWTSATTPASTASRTRPPSTRCGWPPAPRAWSPTPCTRGSRWPR